MNGNKQSFLKFKGKKYNCNLHSLLGKLDKTVFLIIMLAKSFQTINKKISGKLWPNYVKFA